MMVRELKLTSLSVDFSHYQISILPVNSFFPLIIIVISADQANCLSRVARQISKRKKCVSFDRKRKKGNVIIISLISSRSDDREKSHRDDDNRVVDTNESKGFHFET